MRTALAAALATVALLLVSLTTAGPAAAHAELVSSTPAAGARLDRLPGQVVLTFSQTVRTPASVALAGPDGATVQVGETTTRDAEVLATVGEAVGPGQYVLAYRVTSADGHPISGTIRFTVADGATGGDGAATEQGDHAGHGGGPADVDHEALGHEALGHEALGHEALGHGERIGTAGVVGLGAVLLVGLAGVALATRRALRHVVATARPAPR